MNTQNFDEQSIDLICQSLLSKMQPLEDERICVVKRLRKFWRITLSVIAVAGAFIYFYRIKLMSSETAIMWIIGGIVVLLIAIFVFYAVYVNSLLKLFKSRFKDEVIRYFISSFMPGSSYDPDNHISMGEYCNSSLFQQAYDRYSGQNYVSGAVDKTTIYFSELHTEYKTETRTKNGKRTEWHTIFKGVFMVADPNKNFKGETYILSDYGERYFGGIGKWFQKNIGDSRGKVVYLEDPIFEKKFAVYSTDAVEARYLITPQMQQRMITLANHVGGEVCASFVGGKLYLAISKSDGLFRVDTNLSLVDIKTLKYYTRDITNMLSIVHILDLNTRIWGKN